MDKLIAAGNTADVYLREGKIVKLFKDFLPDTEAEYEANKQRFAYSQGLPVPYVFEVTAINGRQAVIMEYAAGKTLGELVFGDKTTTERYMSLSVDIQLRIHDVKANDFELMTDKLARQLRSASALSERQQDALLEKLHGMRFDKRLCHGDYHIFNVILGEAGATVIDWVDASAGDAKADAYRTYLLYSQYSTELADGYLRLYCEKSGTPQSGIFAWAPIVAGARLSENVASEKAGRLLETVSRFCPA
ncbi:MAG: aminoglycoside phosphotransferase family protein [Oscillospiraceae bacterium]|nr:aminoglycoside phosphotransferase family protein [Oscillospiraceae bacterium]